MPRRRWHPSHWAASWQGSEPGRCQVFSWCQKGPAAQLYFSPSCSGRRHSLSSFTGVCLLPFKAVWSSRSFVPSPGPSAGGSAREAPCMEGGFYAGSSWLTLTIAVITLPLKHPMSVICVVRHCVFVDSWVRNHSVWQHSPDAYFVLKEITFWTEVSTRISFWLKTLPVREARQKQKVTDGEGVCLYPSYTCQACCHFRFGNLGGKYACTSAGWRLQTK